MKCQNCNEMKTKIIDTRVDFNGTRRRHLCPRCNERFSTIEIPFTTYQFLVKSLKSLEKTKRDLKIMSERIEQIDTVM